MANKKNNDSALVFIKGARVLTYLVYAYAITACGFLATGFFLLLFSANSSTAFVKFVYDTAAIFLAPFRGIFPVKPVGETGYFSSSALFAIIMYMLLALGMHALINYLTMKMVNSQRELDRAERQRIS